MIYYPTTTPKTEREEYLEDELDRYRREDAKRYEEYAAARRERRDAARANAEYEMRSATTWKESLQKQIVLCQRERDIELQDCQEYGGDPTPEAEDHFSQTVTACERGLEVWKDVERQRQIFIDELMKQIEAIKQQIRLDVAQRLEQEASPSNSGWMSVVKALRSDDDPSDWLQSYRRI